MICISTLTWISLLGNFVSAEAGSRVLGSSRSPRRVTTSEYEKLGNKSEAEGSQRIPDGVQSYENFLRYRMQEDEMKALGEVLIAITTKQLERCSLVVAFDSAYVETNVIRRLITLPYIKQVLHVTSSKDLSSLIWESSDCRGYFILMQEPGPLFNFLETGEEPWDYEGKYIFVGLTKAQLERVTSSPRGKKTQHIIGLIKYYMANIQESAVLGKRGRTGQQVAVHRFTSNAEIFPDKISNLKGATISLITFGFAPHVLYGRGTGGQHAGRDMQVAFALSRVLNFTLKLLEPPRGELWGSKLENGTWTGLVAALERNVGHIGMANIFLSNNNDRTDVQGFTRSYDADVSCFMARTDPPQPHWQSLALPFLEETWLATFFGLLLFCVLLYFTGRLSAIFGKERGTFQSLISSSLYTWGIHFRVSLDQVPEMAPTRIMAVFLGIYAMILTTAYCSNLTAFLTIARPPRSIETIKQLHGSGQEILGMGYFFRTSLSSSGNVYIKNLAERYHALSDFDEALSLLKGGRGVFLESRKYLEYLISTKFTVHGVPQMRIMKECYAPYSIAIATQKHFPMKKSFDRAIGWISESGLVRRWFLDVLSLTIQVDAGAKEMETAAENGDLNAKGVIPLGIDHMQGLFYILIFSLTLSTLVFAVEISCCKG
ncbi:ionotropic receptor 93a-like [Macrobrachium nipponense]|uniref:ionotropic receptor 93a-like n=1 Tax=Macrobrachium nipponense TaxID=159736 RepID=UPI0030C7F576